MAIYTEENYQLSQQTRFFYCQVLDANNRRILSRENCYFGCGCFLCCCTIWCQKPKFFSIENGSQEFTALFLKSHFSGQGCILPCCFCLMCTPKWINDYFQVQRNQQDDQQQEENYIFVDSNNEINKQK